VTWRLVDKGSDVAYDKPQGGPSLFNRRETVKTLGMYDIRCECGKVHIGHIGWLVATRVRAY